MNRAEAEAFFKNAEIQPGVDAKAKVSIPNKGAPYEVARSFLFHRHSVGGVAVLRWWNGELRRWVGTHYAPMEEDELRAEVYQFLARANEGKFDPAQRHVNAVIDAIKARVFLSADVEVGMWLGDGGASCDGSLGR